VTYTDLIQSALLVALTLWLFVLTILIALIEKGQ
jgi:hypothetical protein